MDEIKITDLLLEKYLLNELPPDTFQYLKARIKNDVQLQNKIQQLKESNTQFFSDYPEEAIFEEIESVIAESESHPVKSPLPKPSFLKKSLIVSPVLAAGLLFFILLLPGLLIDNKSASTNNDRPPDTMKGENPIHAKQTRLLVFRKQNKKIEALTMHSTARDGDLLQLAYFVHSKTFGMIFAIDGNRTVTLLFPETQDQTTVMQPGRRVYLSHSYTLDDAPDFERFFLITSHKQIDTDALLKKIHGWAAKTGLPETAPLHLGDPFQEYSIVIKKK